MLAAVHAVTDRVQPLENSKAMLGAIAAVMIAANMGDDEPNAHTINQSWRERGFGWRIVRVQ